ncbi:MAG: hypothetical protein GF411_15865 [Candidatus Lokiarchaeota archaeon]|nr:hypothetical protein [Candidatus Lokiarchaeota archaeon]
MLRQMQEGGVSQSQMEPVRERIRSDRKYLYEVLLTAIVFGLTLNLLSNALWDIQYVLSFENSWYVTLTIVSAISTVVLFYLLIRQYLRDDCVRIGNITAILLWDVKKKQIVDIEPLYLFQEIAKLRMTNNLELQSKMKEKLSLSLEESRDVLYMLFSNVLRYWIREPGFFDSILPKDYKELFGAKNREILISASTYEIPFPTSISERTSDIPKLFRIKVKGNDIRLEFSVKITQVYLSSDLEQKGTISMIEIASSKLSQLFSVASISQNRIVFEFDIRIRAETSALRAFLQSKSIDKIEWIEDFMQKISVLDYRFSLAQEQMKQYIERQKYQPYGDYRGFGRDQDSLGW